MVRSGGRAGMCGAGAAPPKAHAMTPCARAANNQWKLGEELVEELSQTSFRRALQLAKGTVSILDRNGIVFKRVWCCYEVRLAVHSSDVAELSRQKKG